jgi:carboxyl-terminal processing protease
MRTVVLAAACALVAAPQGSAQAAAAGVEDSLSKHLSVYTEILSLVDLVYVDETDRRTLVAGSIEGVMDALDPFAVYVPAAEVDGYLAARSAARDRGGLMVLKERGVALVLAVEENSPAAEAGIRQGDILKTIDGADSRQIPAWKLRQILGQPPGTRVAIELVRAGVTRAVELALEVNEPAPVSLRKVEGAPVLRIPGFSERTLGELDELRLELEAPDLVIDLRGVAGGDLTVAYAVAERFAEGELGSLVGPQGPIERYSSAIPPIWKPRLAVLVDRSTQGAAEVLATVLRQACGARLVGGSTFGHAGKIESISLTSGSLMELTTAFYTGPDLEPLSRSLEPDETVHGADRDEEDKSDEVLERAIELLLEG